MSMSRVAQPVPDQTIGMIQGYHVSFPPGSTVHMHAPGSQASFHYAATHVVSQALPPAPTPPPRRTTAEIAARTAARAVRNVNNPLAIFSAVVDGLNELLGGGDPAE